MDGEWIETIGAIAGGETEQSACLEAATTFWQSSGINPQPLVYEVSLPAGLHFGCGLTPGLESIADFGEMRVSGAGATLVICETPASMTTSLAAGQFHSAGLTIMPTELEAFGALAAFARRQGQTCLALEAVPVPVVARLAMPIDPWFQGTARDMAREARALELLAVFEEALCDRARPRLNARRSHRLAMAARDILEAEFAASLSLATLAARVGCSPRTLTDAFRAVFGISVGGYVTRRRLEEGARLLRDGLRPSEAAYRIGYSPAHFAVAFKRQHGLPPSRWQD
ncbi:helix-turn-helix domain-containing protein [Rhizorhabdus sp. FW153]|uniref:helix-turn-helix domain-containing protein n=1 Tax=Rhizorhabdus sp. FW153 TaxID=3400216 RepID=UPI003CF94D95